MRYLHIFLLFIIADLYSFALYAQEKMLILTPSCFSDMVDTYIQSKPEMICTTLVCDTMESTQIKLRIDSLSHYFSADYLLIIGDHELIPSFPVQDGLSDIYYTWVLPNIFCLNRFLYRIFMQKIWIKTSIF